MKVKSAIQKINKSKTYGFIIAFIIFVLLLLANLFPSLPFFNLIGRLDDRLMDSYFFFKTQGDVSYQREGVTTIEINRMASQDILLLGIDEYALQTFGRWPFPRSVHGNFLKNLARIQDQNQRENSALLDIFFLEPSSNAVEDIFLSSGIEINQRTFLEIIANQAEADFDYNQKMFTRLETLMDLPQGRLRVNGDVSLLPSFFSVEAPLSEFAKNAAGFGHAIFLADSDGVFRRQFLVLKTAQLVGEFPYVAYRTTEEDSGIDPKNPDYLIPKEEIPLLSANQNYAYLDRDNTPTTIDLDDTNETIKKIFENALYRLEDVDEDGTIDHRVYYIRIYQNRIVPSITLALAARYFHKSLDQIEVNLGDSIVIKNPMVFDSEKGELVPYQKITYTEGRDDSGNSVLIESITPIPEIRIPIDEKGQMLVNFLGPRTQSTPGGLRTFNYNSYADYARRVTSDDPSTWPLRLPLANKILMVGPFSSGMAEDEKTTPLGLMYGVEIHANALNTIIMNNFIQKIHLGGHIVLLLVLISFMAFLSSRLPTFVSLPSGLLLLFSTLVIYLVVFDLTSFYIPFGSSALGISFTFISILAYRVITEEADKKRIKGMFSKYVSPEVVNQILDKPPELGGVDKELTVLFSDVRGFTSLSESMSAQELVNHLNIYLTLMTDIIMEYRGTLDKYVGDEIMCFWGAPLNEPDHALLACQCALRQMEALNKLNLSFPENRKIHIGIGLNSGIMTVGNMGSPGRMNYTLMGDNVNLGARLEGTNKEYRTNIIISEFTYNLVADQGAIVRELDNIRVKGKNKPVLIYELIDFEQGYYPPGIKKR